MLIRRSTRRITAWLAMLVLVLNTLTPLAAQVMLAPAGPGDVIEICTSTGMMRVALGEQDDSGQPGSTQMQECPCCLLHGGQAWLPPTPVIFPPVPRYAAMPPAFYQAADTSAVWLAALSRGPPSLLH